jgi:hypothetical protein
VLLKRMALIGGAIAVLCVVLLLVARGIGAAQPPRADQWHIRWQSIDRAPYTVNHLFVTDHALGVVLYVGAWEGELNNLAPNSDGAVAFTLDTPNTHNVYVWQDGRLTLVTSDADYSTQVAWADDRRLAFNALGDIFVWTDDGSEAINITNTPTLMEHRPRWGALGRLFFETDTQKHRWDGVTVEAIAGAVP